MKRLEGVKGLQAVGRDELLNAGRVEDRGDQVLVKCRETAFLDGGDQLGLCYQQSIEEVRAATLAG